MAKKIIRLTEAELVRIAKKIIKEQEQENIISQKIEDIVDKPKVEHHIENMISNLSPEELDSLRGVLDDLGIDEYSDAKYVHDKIMGSNDGMSLEMDEEEESHSNTKHKVREILHDIGAANIAAWGGVPAAIAIGSMTGMPLGFVISWGVTGLLMGIAKALGKK